MIKWHLFNHSPGEICTMLSSWDMIGQELGFESDKATCKSILHALVRFRNIIFSINLAMSFCF